jgi:hypothetical protein
LMHQLEGGWSPPSPPLDPPLCGRVGLGRQRWSWGRVAVWDPGAARRETTGTGTVAACGCGCGGKFHAGFSIFVLYMSWSSRFSSLFSFLSHLFILYIIFYSLWGSLVTLSKYIHVRSGFEGFIEINSMV